MIVFDVKWMPVSVLVTGAGELAATTVSDLKGDATGDMPPMLPARAATTITPNILLAILRDSSVWMRLTTSRVVASGPTGRCGPLCDTPGSEGRRTKFF
jgi:hypothetical protein